MTLTSMRKHLFVGFDDLHVNPELTVAHCNTPPILLILELLPCRIFRDRLHRVLVRIITWGRVIQE